MNFGRLRTIRRISHLYYNVLRKDNLNAGYYATEKPLTFSVSKFLSQPQPHLPKHKFRQNSTKAAVKADPDIHDLITKIENKFNVHGNSNFEDLSKLIDAFERFPDLVETLSREQTVLLLDSCGDLMTSESSKNRMHIFNKLWKLLKSNYKLEKQHYLAAINVCRVNRMPVDDYESFLFEKQVDGKSIDGEIYESLIYMACGCGNVQKATEILAIMRRENFLLTENVFNALILGHSRNKDIVSCQSVIESMNASGVKMSSDTYAELMRAFVENGQIEKATAILKEHKGQFHSNQLVKVLKASAFEKQYEFMELLIRELPAEMLNSKEVPTAIRNICTELIYANRVDEAQAVIQTLPTPRFNENQDIDTFGVSIINDLFRSKSKDSKIIEFCESLMESKKNERALHIACDIAMRRVPDQVLPFLTALSQKEQLRPHYFWPLMLHHFKRHGEAGILRTLEIMSDIGVECDNETISYYVLPRLSTTLENGIEAVKSLEACGLKTSQILTPIISHMIGQQKLDNVCSLAQIYTSKLDTTQFVIPLAILAKNVRATKSYRKFAEAIQSLARRSENHHIDFVGHVLLEMVGNVKLRNDLPALKQFIQEIKTLGCRISPAAVETLSGNFSKIKNNHDIPIFEMIDKKLSLSTGLDKTESFIVHPRDMSLDELECHLIELESKGLNTRGVLRRLLQLCVRDGRLERALEVKKKCDELKVQTSPGMLASVFDMYIKLKDLKNATESLNKLQKNFPGFFIDEHKIIDYAALMVLEKQVDAAKKILSDRTASTKVVGGDYVIKNVWNFLTNVAHLAASNPNSLEKEQNLTRDAFVFLYNLGFCKSHNAILGPIVREYLLRNDIISAVSEFKKLATHYRHTPLQFELLSLLVHLSNGKDLDKFQITENQAKELLHDATVTIANIHGTTNMNSALLLAIAESGTEGQLRKLLINPDFRINEELLIRNCDHLSAEGSMLTLTRLAKASRGLGHVIKEQDIYNTLLRNFAKANNYSAALQLFERLEADDELKISQDFLRNLISLLKINKVLIPSNIALRAQVM